MTVLINDRFTGTENLICIQRFLEMLKFMRSLLTQDWKIGKLTQKM